LIHKKSKSYCQVKNKVDRCDIVPAWLAVTVEL
jgi:hypothetical protein